MTELLTAAVLASPLRWLGIPPGWSRWLLVLDLGVLHRDQHEIGVRESLMLSAGYLSLGLAFGGWVWFQLAARPPGVRDRLSDREEPGPRQHLRHRHHLRRLRRSRAYQHRVLFWACSADRAPADHDRFGAALWPASVGAPGSSRPSWRHGRDDVRSDGAPKTRHDSPVTRWLAAISAWTKDFHGPASSCGSPARAGSWRGSQRRSSWPWSCRIGRRRLSLSTPCRPSSRSRRTLHRLPSNIFADPRPAGALLRPGRRRGAVRLPQTALAALLILHRRQGVLRRGHGLEKFPRPFRSPSRQRCSPPVSAGRCGRRGNGPGRPALSR